MIRKNIQNFLKCKNKDCKDIVSLSITKILYINKQLKLSKTNWGWDHLYVQVK